MNQRTNWLQFGILTIVFFFWGFIAASNDILIPVFKKSFNLLQAETQMVSFAFYIAYTLGAMIYFFVSKGMKQDILNVIGYRNGICLGLLVSALGTLVIYPASNMSSFPLMLLGLFVIGLGFAFQQIAANSLAILLGNPETSSQRMNVGGGINNVGTTVGPLLVSFAIFGSVSSVNPEADIRSVKYPYLIIGAALIFLAVFFRFSPLPNKFILSEYKSDDSDKKNRPSVFNYPQLVFGMIAIFIYVGVEVSTVSNLPEYMRQHLNVPTDRIAPYISLYWASLMMGRWTGAVGAFDLRKGHKKILRFLMPYFAFGLFLIVNAIAQHDLQQFYIYSLVIILVIAGDVLSRGNPATMVFVFSSMSVVALIVGIFTTNMISLFAFISIGLFCGTLWPCIYSLALTGLGKHINQGGSLLVMMIMGGGVISLFQGFLAADSMLGIRYSYIVDILGFAYLIYYGIKSKAILKSQGIEYCEKPVNIH